jgi:hypothetical protein
VADRADVMRAERAAVAELLGYKAEPYVPPEERTRARQDVARVKAYDEVLGNIDRGILDRAKSMGVSPRPFSANGAAFLAELCGQSSADGSPASTGPKQGSR